MRVFALISIFVLVVAALILAKARQAVPPEPVYQGRAVSLWALDLNHPSEAVRQSATDAVKTFESDTVPALVRLLRTPDPVLARPVNAIGSRAPARVRGALFRMVNPYEAASKRASAAQALRVMGPNASTAMPALERALRGDKAMAWHAALALARLGDPGTEALTKALPLLPPAQCNYACYALGTQGGRASKAVSALGKVLRTGPQMAAEAAAIALGEIRGPAIGTLIDALGDEQLHVRLLAIKTLASLGPAARAGVPKLIAMSGAELPGERAAVVEALGRIQPISSSAVAPP